MHSPPKRRMHETHLKKHGSNPPLLDSLTVLIKEDVRQVAENDQQQPNEEHRVAVARSDGHRRG